MTHLLSVNRSAKVVACSPCRTEADLSHSPCEIWTQSRTVWIELQLTATCTVVESSGALSLSHDSHACTVHFEFILWGHAWVPLPPPPHALQATWLQNFPEISTYGRGTHLILHRSLLIRCNVRPVIHGPQSNQVLLWRVRHILPSNSHPSCLIQMTRRSSELDTGICRSKSCWDSS